MKQLKPNETARAGDWFFVFGGVGWIQLDQSPKPIFRMTIQQMDKSNKKPHFPIVVMRPNYLERILGTVPTYKPNQHKIRKGIR